MANSNRGRFSPEGTWLDIDGTGLGDLVFVLEVEDLVEKSLRCQRIEGTLHISVPEELRESFDGFVPVPRPFSPRVSSLRMDDQAGLVDIIGFGKVQGDTLGFLVTLKREEEGRYSLWSPVSIVP